MQIKEIRPVQVVVEVICDCCGESTTVDRENGVHEYATLSADWGYHSKHDNESYRYQLCESCFFGVLAHLRQQARALGMFGENHPVSRLKGDRFEGATDKPSPMSKLRGSVGRFDRPTEPVWPDDEEEENDIP